jgi:hypothetical protein
MKITELVLINSNYFKVATKQALTVVDKERVLYSLKFKGS